MSLHTTFRLAINSDQVLTQKYEPQELAQLIDIMFSDMEHIVSLNVMRSFSKIQCLAMFKCWLAHASDYARDPQGRLDSLARSVSFMLMPPREQEALTYPSNVAPLSHTIH